MPLFNHLDHTIFLKIVDLVRTPSILKWAVIVMAVNIVLFPARRIIPRLCGRWGYRWLYVCVFLVLFGVVPVLLFCVVILKLAPIFVGGSWEISLSVLFLYWRQVCLLAMVVMPIGMSLYLIPYLGRFLRHYPRLVDAVMAVLIMRFVGELIIYVRYPDHLLISYYEKMFVPFIFSAVFILQVI